MKKHEILKKIIDHFFEYDSIVENQEDYSLEEFIGYLNSRIKPGNAQMRKIEGNENNWIRDEFRTQASEISVLIALMFRYAKGYIKKALKDSILQTADEFSFLITLMTFESLTKSELIAKQVIEKTSGTEIIRRLANHGLIVEFPGNKDKRNRLVSITDKGRNEILSVLPMMSRVSDIVVGNLSDEEINTLAYLLKKLDHFHNDIYVNKRKMSIDDLLNNRNYVVQH